MDWDNPAERAALIERVGPAEYNRQIAAHHAASRIETVNGHGIRPVGSRFGRLFFVEGLNTGYTTLEQARAAAASAKG